MPISRLSKAVVVTVASGANVSEVIDMTGMAGGIISIPSGFSDSVGFYHSDDENGTFTILEAEDSTTIVGFTTYTAGRSKPLPSELFSARFVKVWTHSGGSNANQGSDREFRVSMKG